MTATADARELLLARLETERYTPLPRRPQPSPDDGTAAQAARRRAPLADLVGIRRPCHASRSRS